MKSFSAGGAASFKLVGIVGSFPAFSDLTGAGAKAKQTACQQGYMEDMLNSAHASGC
jgi:hypothetical protein